MKIFASALALILASGSIFAATKTEQPQNTTQEKPKVNHWKGTSIGAGYVANTGNTTSENFNLNANIQYTKNKWVHTGIASYQFDHTRKSGTTANKLVLQQRSQYNFTTSNSLYTQIKYTNDKFDGYQYVLNLNAGYGFNLGVPHNMSLNLFLGPGVRRSVLEQTNQTQDDPSLQIGSNYSWTINEKTTLTEQLQTNIAKINVNTTSDTTLATKLFDNVSLQLSYQLSNDSKPVDGKSKFNSTSSVLFAYTF